MSARPLPDAVRARVVALAADVLGTLEPDVVPAALRHVVKFRPQARARAGATPIATALQTEEAFRRIVASTVRTEQPALAQALDAGTPPAAADPVDVAAVAWLLQAPGWEDAVARVESTAGAAVAEQAVAAETRMREQLDAARTAARADLAKLRAEVTAAKAEADRLRRELRQEKERADRAEAAAGAARADQAGAERRAADAARSADREMRRLRAQIGDLESAVEAARRAERESRGEADVRLRLLVDTVTAAAQGLARELALPPAATRPADTVAGGSAPVERALTPRALAADDPALLDELVRLPGAHLLVDGYNVTKTGYGELPLERQRERLLTALSGLAARTRAEVTCVFDGAEQSAPVAASTPRNVRLRFSDPGVTADELIRRLVRAEPPGRPVVVVSSDREVADGVEAAGATAVPSATLLRLLDGR